jgi:hypothetical protein
VFVCGKPDDVLNVFREHSFGKAFCMALDSGQDRVSELFNPPSPGILKEQPKWGFYVIWAGMVQEYIKKGVCRSYQQSACIIPGRLRLP